MARKNILGDLTAEAAAAGAERVPAPIAAGRPVSALWRAARRAC
jgi:hypothetical protein